MSFVFRVFVLEIRGFFGNESNKVDRGIGIREGDDYEMRED